MTANDKSPAETPGPLEAPEPVATPDPDANPEPAATIEPVAHPEPAALGEPAATTGSASTPTAPATSAAPATPSESPAAMGGRGRAVWATIAVVGVIAVIAGGLFGYRIAAGRLDGAKKIDRAQVLLEEVDGAVVAIDKVVASEVTTDSAERAADLTPTIAPAKTKLARVQRLLREARPSATDEDQRRVDLLGDAASARLAMLEQAPDILEASVKAATAKEAGEQAWARAGAGEQLSDQAVAQFNKLNKAAAQQSSQLDAQAQAEYQAAKELMTKAETSFPEANFEAYLAYIDAKLAQIALSRQATAAYLKGDVVRANQLAATFNVEDKRLVEVAKALPASPGSVVAEAYERTAEAATNAYFTARDAATKADDGLRRF